MVGVTLEQLRRADRVLAVAGGPSKYLAIRAALLGEWVNTLVTDLSTAEHLIARFQDRSRLVDRYEVVGQ